MRLSKFFFIFFPIRISNQSNFFSSVNSICGYANPLSFKNISDNDIEYVEQIVRENAINIAMKDLKKNIGSDCEILLDDHQLTDIFGKMYKSNHTEFRFLRGEIQLIKELVDHVKLVVDGNGKNSGLHKFKVKIKKPRLHQNRERKKLKIDTHDKDEPTTTKSNNTNHNSAGRMNLKVKLQRKVEACLKQYSVDKLLDIEFLEEGIVDIEEVDGQIYGSIICVICKNQNKKNQRPKRVYYKESAETNSWVMSNFTKHLTNTHHLVSINNYDMKNKAIELDAAPKVEKHKEIAVGDDSDLYLLEAAESEDDRDKQKTINDIQLYEQLAQNITKMNEATLINDDHQEKMRCIPMQNTNACITIATIPGDGDCLFGSIVHQIFRYPVNSKLHKNAAKQLRTDVVHHILAEENFVSFQKLLMDRILETKSKNQIVDSTAECKKFVTDFLSQKGAWGGAESIKAISDLYRTNIITFYEDESVYFVGGKEGAYNQTIAIAFRIGFVDNGKPIRNHFDSVCNMNSSDISTVTDIVVKRMKLLC